MERFYWLTCDHLTLIHSFRAQIGCNGILINARCPYIIEHGPGTISSLLDTVVPLVVVRASVLVRGPSVVRGFEWQTFSSL